MTDSSRSSSPLVVETKQSKTIFHTLYYIEPNEDDDNSENHSCHQLTAVR
jgi:hypothetical protein